MLHGTANDRCSCFSALAFVSRGVVVCIRLHTMYTSTVLYNYCISRLYRLAEQKTHVHVHVHVGNREKPCKGLFSPGAP
eukprot:COSAG02_NODE_7674_length_2900_cov_3.148518_2_plen_79_part_00